MSFKIVPNFDALAIARSQAQKYHLQNILYYHNSELRILGTNNDKEGLDVAELERVMGRVIEYEGDELEFPCLSQEKIVDHISNVMASFMIKLAADPEIFVESITVNVPGRGVKEILYEEIGTKIQELIREDQTAVLKMDLYIALPYNEGILSDDPSSFHFPFLEKFQEKWGITRPWRYVSVRNWIYVPRITVYGDEIYDLEPVGEYLRVLTFPIVKIRLQEELNYDLIRKFYAYLQIEKYFSQKVVDPRRFQDQITFGALRSLYDDGDSETLTRLETFFEESSTSFVYSLLCDLRTCKRIKQLYPCIDPDFVQQSLQTIEYLLKEHHIPCDIEVLEKYIEDRLKEETIITISEIEKVF